jgi:hypothetical protein
MAFLQPTRYLCTYCGQVFFDYNRFIQHWYQHFGFHANPTTNQGDTPMSEDLPDTEENTEPKFRIHRVSDMIMETFQLIFALQRISSVATDDEKQILKKMQRLALDDFFEALSEDASVVLTTKKTDFKRELETWKENQEKRKKELEQQQQKESDEKPRRKKKVEGEKEDD